MADSILHDLLRALPQVEEVLTREPVARLCAQLPRTIVVDCVRGAVATVRENVLAGQIKEVDIDAIAADACLRALVLERQSLRHVINATGVVIHTNLGRSPLAPSAAEAVSQVANGYSTLEYNTRTLSRGSRHDHVEHLICALTGAEAAIAVNNNAAAVMMVLSEFAAGHEAVVSRGELVEIGGSFRVPDIMSLSRATMVEVGTTNKTHAADYTAVINDHTAMLLKVHPSNFRLIGFTESVGVKELRGLADAENARRHKRIQNSEIDGALPTHNASALSAEVLEEVLVYEDQGSGVLIPLTCFGEYVEPTVADSLAAGSDLVSFSGDKLLGGPQAGIIVGSKRYIDRLKKNPLARVLRLDKMTLAALEATLRLYLDEKSALRNIPTLRMLTEPAEDVRVRAETLAFELETALPKGCVQLEVIPEIARAGGGALPMCDIPTFAVAVTFLRGDAQDCERYLVSQRALPVVGRIKKERLLFDARTLIGQDDIDEIQKAMSEYFQVTTSASGNSVITGALGGKAEDLTPTKLTDVSNRRTDTKITTSSSHLTCSPDEPELS